MKLTLIVFGALFFMSAFAVLPLPECGLKVNDGGVVQPSIGSRLVTEVYFQEALDAMGYLREHVDSKLCRLPVAASPCTIETNTILANIYGVKIGNGAALATRFKKREDAIEYAKKIVQYGFCNDRGLERSGLEHLPECSIYFDEKGYGYVTMGDAVMNSAYSSAAETANAALKQVRERRCVMPSATAICSTREDKGGAFETTFNSSRVQLVNHFTRRSAIELARQIAKTGFCQLDPAAQDPGPLPICGFTVKNGRPTAMIGNQDLPASAEKN